MTQPLDLWLARQLRAQNDAALRERVPDELVRLAAMAAALSAKEATGRPG